MEATYFTDGKGTKWSLMVGVHEARRMKREADVDIDQLEDGKVFMDLATSRMKLAGCLWILCESAADRQQVDEIEFAKRLTADCLDEAVIALVGAIINFTPDSKRKAMELVHQKMIEAIERGSATMQSWATDNQRKIDQQIDQEVTEKLEQAFGSESAR